MENAAELSSPLSALALSEQERSLLAATRRVADAQLEPNAEKVDNGISSVRENLDALAAEGLIGVTTPTEWGGSGAGGVFQREFTELITAACGTTWFTLTQHLGACGQIAGSGNASLRERYLRDMAAGRHYVGVGFGHLRRLEPMLRAEPVSDGWILNGVAPWVTGWPFLSGVIYGATLPDNRHLYVYVPATESETQVSSTPLPLCAMNGSATTEVRLIHHFAPETDFVRYSSREEMARGDDANIASVVHPPLGCARGSLKLLRELAQKRTHLVAITDAAETLEQEIVACRIEARRRAEAPKDAPDYKSNALKARAWAIELGVRAALMTVAAASGAANSREHPAQRRLREAMFYTLTAQTGDIMTATLQRLSRSN